MHAVELAGEIERLLARPGELHQFEILGGAPVALDLRAEVAVAVLLLVGLAGDDVHGEPAVGQVIEGRDLARHQGRRDEARPVRHQVAEPLGVRGGMQRDEEALRGRGRVADQREVEAGLVVGARKLRSDSSGDSPPSMTCSVASLLGGVTPIIPMIRTGTAQHLRTGAAYGATRHNPAGSDMSMEQTIE